MCIFLLKIFKIYCRYATAAYDPRAVQSLSLTTAFSARDLYPPPPPPPSASFVRERILNPYGMLTTDPRVRMEFWGMKIFVHKCCFLVCCLGFRSWSHESEFFFERGFCTFECFWFLCCFFFTKFHFLVARCFMFLLFCHWFSLMKKRFCVCFAFRSSANQYLS